jgi:hypothetical protein
MMPRNPAPTPDFALVNADAFSTAIHVRKKMEPDRSAGAAHRGTLRRFRRLSTFAASHLRSGHRRAACATKSTEKPTSTLRIEIEARPPDHVFSPFLRVSE